MPKSIQQLSGNLWKPSAAKLDGPSKLNNRLVKPKSFTALPPETPAEANFIKKNGPVNSESWKKSFPPKPPRKKASSAPKKLPSNPLSSMVPNAAPGHPVLPSGKPNQVFYSNQSNQLANVLSGAPKSPVQRARPFTANELGQLKQANPLAHDRYAALAPKQMQGVQSFGPMNDLTMLIPKSAGGKKSSAPSRFMPRVDPNQFEEIFSATNPKSGNPKALGTRQSGDNWYVFGTEVGEGIQKPSSAGKGTFGRGDEAASWFAPESYVAGDLPGGKPGPGMGSKAVIDDVQGIMEGPWQDYLKGPAVGDGEHGVQAVHGSSDGNGFDTFMGQFDKAKGILGSIQSAANSIQSLANLAGLADSLGKFGGMLGSLSEFSIPSSPGEMVTSLLKGSGCLGPPAPKTDATASVATGVDGIVVTIGGAGAEADGNARLDQLGKNESGDGSQSQGEGADKSVSKDSTGGDVELGNDSKPSDGQSSKNSTDSKTAKPEASESEKQELADSDDLVASDSTDSQSDLPANENQSHIGNLSLEDAKEGSDIAYKGEKGDLTPNGKWEVAEVYEDNAGMRAVLLEPTDPNESRRVLAYAGTTFEPLSPLDTARDLSTNVRQVLGQVPAQYQHAEQLAGDLKEKYGDDLVLTGHSLGGGEANYAAAMNDLPGVGLNSAPLGSGTTANINQTNPDGPNKFVHYNNKYDPVSQPISPGEQLGEIYTIHEDYGWGGYGFSDHSVSNIDPDGDVRHGKPERPKMGPVTPSYVPYINPNQAPPGTLETPGRVKSGRPGDISVAPSGSVTNY